MLALFLVLPVGQRGGGGVHMGMAQGRECPRVGMGQESGHCFWGQSKGRAGKGPATALVR